MSSQASDAACKAAAEIATLLSDRFFFFKQPIGEQEIAGIIERHLQNMQEDAFIGRQAKAIYRRWKREKGEEMAVYAMAGMVCLGALMGDGGKETAPCSAD